MKNPHADDSDQQWRQPRLASGLDRHQPPYDAERQGATDLNEEYLVARAAMLAALDPIVTIDAGGVIVCVSDSIRQVLGWHPSELIGRNVKILMPEPHRSRHDVYLRRYSQTGESKILGQPRRFDALHKNGTAVPIELSVSRTTKPGNGPLFVGIIRDVRRQLEEERTHDEERAHFERQIAEQTSALQEAHLHLRIADRMASIGTFAAGLCHDINNVLLPIRSQLEVLSQSDSIGDNGSLIQSIRAAVDYLQQHADGLSFLLRDLDPDAATSTRLAWTNLATWWQDVGLLLSKAVPSRVSVQGCFDPDLPLVGISPHALTQAVLNLVTNAGAACDRHNGDQRGEVRVRAEEIGVGEARRVHIVVSDNGAGMSETTLRRAFDLFFTTKPRGFGTGLGLALVRKVTEDAGGKARIESAMGKGTTVTLDLPSIPPSAMRQSDGVSQSVAIMVSDQRTASLIRQLIGYLGLREADTLDASVAVCVVDANCDALLSILQWRSEIEDSAIVLIGNAPECTDGPWAFLSPIASSRPDDPDSIRDAIEKAVAAISGSQSKEH